jgi:hypothetical protein
VYQYINKGIADLKLTYSRMADTPAPLMYGHSDADYWATTDIDERRTCISYCLFLSGAVILWLTRFWKPCLSSMEGELGGVTDGQEYNRFPRTEGFTPPVLALDQRGYPHHGYN